MITREDIIKIVQSFDKWLEDTSKEYNLDKTQLQAMIKQFLIG